MNNDITYQRPQIGIGVIITKNNTVLIGKRKNAHGDSMWGFPGGHLELNESWEDCAARETREETNVSIKNIQFVAVTNDLFLKEEKHYVTIFMQAEYASGTVEIMEPDKCSQWQWFTWGKLPQPLFLPIENLLHQGYHPFDHSK